MQLIGSNGETYSTGDSAENDNPHVKLAQDQPTKNRGEIRRRIAFLLERNVCDTFSKNVTWPIDTLHDQNGRYWGYAISALPDGVSLRFLAATQSIRYVEKLAIAKNLCIAVEHVHASHMSCGALTLDNILIDPQTCRVMIAYGERFPFSAPNRNGILCTTVIPEYIAPELQGLDLSSTRHRNSGRFAQISERTDAFSLAVVLYALFSRGRHPFNYRLNGTDAIRSLLEKRSPSSRPRAIACMHGRMQRFSLRNETIPVLQFRSPLPLLPMKLARAFSRSFARGRADASARLSAEEWHVLFCELDRTPRARISRWLHSFGMRRHLKEGETSEDARTTIYSKAIKESSKASSYALPSVFWPTTAALAIGYGLSNMANGIDPLWKLASCAIDVPEPHLSWGYVLVACASVLAFGSIVRSHSARWGYALSHYAGAVLCTLLTSFLFSALGSFAG